VKTAGILILAALAALPISQAARAAGPPGAAPADKPAAGEPRVSHRTNGEVSITLDAETRSRVGLQLAALAATNLPPEVKGYGRVLDPAPLLALLAELEPAKVAAEASRKELDRLQTLRAQDNASDRALQAAEAVAVRDRLLVESLRARLVLGWGRAIADSDRLGDQVKSLAALQGALVRIDLPAGEMLPGKPTNAWLVPLATGAKPVRAEFVGPATSTDLQFQGQGFLFLARDGAPTPGAALTGFIQTDGAPLRGLLIPADAVARHAGKSWVWVQTAADTFARREVAPGRARGEAYFVSGGFSVGEKVVTTGAQQLLSEELKGQGGEE
jgi:hypothetical protein